MLDYKEQVVLRSVSVECDAHHPLQAYHATHLPCGAHAGKCSSVFRRRPHDGWKKAALTITTICILLQVFRLIGLKRLSLACEVAVLLEDWDLVARGVWKAYNLLLPLLRVLSMGRLLFQARPLGIVAVVATCGPVCPSVLLDFSDFDQRAICVLSLDLCQRRQSGHSQARTIGNRCV